MTPRMLGVYLVVFVSLSLFHWTSACPKYCECFDLEKDEYSVSCHGPNITAIPRDIPKNTTYMDISFTPITMLRRGDFVDIPKLQELNVWWNLNLTMVEVGTFDNLPTLTSLGLYNNSFTKLPPGLFDKLTHLTRFDAHNSRLETIPRGLFTDHPSLKEISLFYNNIAHLEAGAFSGIPHLKELILAENELTSLDKSVFVGSPKLTSLNVDGNFITSIEKDVFSETPHFQNLNLNENKIHTIEAGAFSPLRHLQSVSLSSNELTNIEGIFQDLLELETITLDGNQVSKINETTFVNLPGLTSLSMNYNNIKEVVDHAFKDLDGLLTLSLENNEIEEINLVGLSSLMTLYLESNKLKYFPANLLYASQIQTLSLEDNPIQEPLENGQFLALFRLSRLYLSNITCLKLAGTLNPKALCGSDALDEVWLSYNGLSTLPSTIFECTPVVSTLWLQNNNLTELSPRLFHGLTELTWLDLSYNRLSRLNPDIFTGLDKLRILDLTGNNFTNMAHVAPTLASLPILASHNLDKNPFVYLGPGSFPVPMKHATALDVSGGHIHVVEEGTFTAATFPNLTRLLIYDGNPLHFVPADILVGLHNLTAFIADNDPFHCDCQMKGFATWLGEQTKPPFVYLFYASPPSLKGKNLNDVPVANLTCHCQHEEAPSIDTSGSDTSVHEGQTAMLKCKISGCPEAEFFWTTPTGAMLAVGSGFPRMEVLDSGTLVVTEAREEDTGVYTCTAVNYRGKARKEIALQVLVNDP
ncbi:IGFALS [Branchiostoma lanceolatum]|uniref:IGFALS protein n=1 Tax=Branchiostoma lanceolatum TaxID=7740 RepID=A0A8J9VKN4_BRALA|nr:IGFALS [Branchiostoma lanceolatum]